MPNTQPYITYGLDLGRTESYTVYGLWQWSQAKQAYECVDTDTSIEALKQRHCLPRPVIVLNIQGE